MTDKTQLTSGERDWAQVALTVTVPGVAYSANDVVGGLITFKGMGKCHLESVLIADAAGQVVNYRLILFKSTPTTITDNATYDIADADLRHILFDRVIDAATYQKVYSTNAVHLMDGLDVLLGSMESTGNIYGYLVAVTVPTYAATTDVVVVLQFMRD